jgi:hypothetical protein
MILPGLDCPQYFYFSDMLFPTTVGMLITQQLSHNFVRPPFPGPLRSVSVIAEKLVRLDKTNRTVVGLVPEKPSRGGVPFSEQPVQFLAASSPNNLTRQTITMSVTSWTEPTTFESSAMMWIALA